MSHIDNINYLSDERTQPPAGVPIVYLELVDDEGERFDEERALPWKWVVCPVCSGKGSHVNPAIDCNGLTGDDFREDPDFEREYFGGLYDQQCNRCQGRTTIPEVDEGACTDAELAAWREQTIAEAEDYAAHLAELRMGA